MRSVHMLANLKADIDTRMRIRYQQQRLTIRNLIPQLRNLTVSQHFKKVATSGNHFELADLDWQLDGI